MIWTYSVLLRNSKVVDILEIKIHEETKVLEFYQKIVLKKPSNSKVAQFTITKWRKIITKWRRNYKVAQNNYKVAQELQSGTKITKWRITHSHMVYEIVNNES